MLLIILSSALWFSVVGRVNKIAVSICDRRLRQKYVFLHNNSKVHKERLMSITSFREGSKVDAGRSLGPPACIAGTAADNAAPAPANCDKSLRNSSEMDCYIGARIINTLLPISKFV